MAWDVETLDSLCEFKNGLWKGKKEPFVRVGVIRNTNFTKGGELDDSDIAYHDVEVKQYSTRQLQFGDLILEKSGGGPKQPVGRIIAFEKKSGDFSFSNFTSVVRVKDKSKLDHSFLHKFLYFLYVTGVTESMQRQSTGIRNLQLNDYKLIAVPVPPLAEQKRIVAILDQAFADIQKARTNAEKNLKNARELFDSYLNQVFSQRGDGWVDLSLREASVDFGRGKSKHRPRNDKSLYGGDFPFIQTGEVRNCNHLITDYAKTYNEKGLSQSKLWPKGTICITIAANIAETGILNFDACFPDSIIGVVVNPKITRISYVEFLLQSFKLILQAEGKGSAQDNINLGTFENMKFPFPPINEQDKIIALLDELTTNIDDLEELYTLKSTSLDELKKSLLQKAFSGELTKAEGAAA